MVTDGEGKGDDETRDTMSVSVHTERKKVTDGPNAPPTDEVPRGTAIGRYLVVHRLGEGGMGVVYSAYDAELDRKVALKLLHPRKVGTAERHARLLREAQAMAKVSHPNVLAIHDVGSFGNQVFMTMDLVEGGTLSAWGKEANRTWQEVVRAMLDAGHGLAAAHAVGLVHRDFKPQNVLVRRDGRVFVTDFGLARMQDAADDVVTDPVPAAERELERRHSHLTGNLTSAGAVVGTPRYMAPEQHLGAAVDARADQFSFCASLYALLWKTHPFDPTSLARRADKLRASESSSASMRSNSRSEPAPTLIYEPPSQPRVPARLRKAIMRGLSLDPEQRFPTMEPLLVEIQAALHPPSTQVAMGAAAAAMVMVAAVGAWAWRDRTRTQLCSGGSAEIASVWSPAVAGAVQAGFVQAAPDRGSELARTLVTAMDGYAGRWVQAHREACEATRIRGEQTESTLSLRMDCLELKRKELAALVRLLEHPDAALVDRALDASQGLSAVSQCGDAQALAQVGMPEDPARRASLQKAEETLARVHALRIAGRYAQGLTEALPAAGVARDLGFKPLEARTRLELALLQDSTGDQKGATGELQRALRLAEAGRDDVTKLRSASRLGYVIGYRQSQPEAGVEWVRLAEATLERLGAERYPELESDVYTFLGVTQLRAGEFPGALAAFQRSLTAVENVPGADLLRTRALANIAAARGRLGEREEAVRSGKLAVAAIERLRGLDHPILVEPLQNLTNDLLELGRYDEALPLADRALRLAETKMGKDHATVADVLDSRACLYLQLERPKEALADAQRALQIHRLTKEANAAEGFSWDAIGRAQLALGKVPDAIASLERGLALQPPDDGVIADIEFGLARALVTARRDPARARDLANKARTAFTTLKNQRKLAQVETWLANPQGSSRGRK
jgi:tetratricopeptide (TPR) repeat protein/tRNA A-37 threonylcarbamoyl transferase component Bud32